MTPREIEAVVRGLYQSFNLKDLDRFDAVALSGASLLWPSYDLNIGLREAWTIWATAFPDAQVEIVRLEVTASKVVAEITGRGTHTGPLHLPSGDVRPTHRAVTLRLVDTFEMDEAEGKIASGHSDFDLGALFAQLGVPPPPHLRRQEAQQAEFHWGY
jgi:hypothetical protein